MAQKYPYIHKESVRITVEEFQTLVGLGFRKCPKLPSGATYIVWEGYYKKAFAIIK